jgi:hypothetical protein
MRLLRDAKSALIFIYADLQNLAKKNNLEIGKWLNYAEVRDCKGSRDSHRFDNWPEALAVDRHRLRDRNFSSPTYWGTKRPE